MSDYNSKIGKHKGFDVLSIENKATQQRIVSFGLTKAKAILAEIEEIKKFVEANSPKVEAE